MFGQQNANAVVVSQNKETIILPLGLLVDLNHMATGVEFIKLAALPGKLQPGARLSPAEIKQALPAILALDAKLMSGSITPIEFRLAVLDILKLTNVSDVEFDKAWNAMLGDVNKIAERLDELKKKNPDALIILTSATSIIHLNYIFNVLQPGNKIDELNNPISLLGIPLYVSFLSDTFKLKPINKSLFEEAFKTQKSSVKQTIVIINPDSKTYDDIKKRDEANAVSIKFWAGNLGMTVIERDGKESVVDAIAKFRNAAAVSSFTQ